MSAERICLLQFARFITCTKMSSIDYRKISTKAFEVRITKSTQKHENVFIDTSAYLPKYYPFQLIQYMQTFGKDKVLFGTNFPQLKFQKCVSQAKDLGLTEEVQKKFFYENAKNVFNI